MNKTSHRLKLILELRDESKEGQLQRIADGLEILREAYEYEMDTDRKEYCFQIYNQALVT